MSEDPISLLTIRQAAKLLNVHPDSLRRWEKQGKLKSLRIGSRKDRRYNVRDLLAIVNPISSSIVQKVKPVHEDQETILKTIRHSSWIFFDVGYTLAALFPSRGDIYADIAYTFGYNLDPLLINRLFYDVEREWDKEKILSQPLAKASKELVAAYYTHNNAEVLMRAGIPRNHQHEALKIGRAIYDAIWSESTLWRMFSHTIPLLEELTRLGKRLAVIENWDTQLISILKTWSIDQYFRFILCGATLKLRKPDPHIFTMALQKAEIQAKNAVYIGDQYTNDVVGPKKVGITPILYDRHRLYTKTNYLKIYSFETIITKLRHPQ